MTHKVGPKGQVVIPKELRDRYGILPGDEVLFEDDAGQIVIRRGERPRLRGLLKGKGPSATELMAANRAAELELEQRKAERRGW